jgi:aryl-alcohol dehydrogenase-like predicted oxidoreductase
MAFLASRVLRKNSVQSIKSERGEIRMEYRQLGGSGFMVPVLSFGTATFAGGESDRAWGNTQVEEATRLVDIALEAGMNFFDTADVYSAGRSETVLGAAVKGRRDQVIITTKATFRSEAGPNGVGSSRYHLIRSCEASLRRLGTDYIDLYTLHGFDAMTPIEETLQTLDDLVRSGKVRYIGCSNFSGWHLMKSLGIAEKYGLPRYIAHQVYYSLAGRDFEWELMPLGIDQKVGTVVWSPLAQGRLTGKVRRDTALPQDSRVKYPSETRQSGDDETLYRTVDVMDEIAAETGRSLSQIAINWLLQRPTVSSIIFGARNEEQLRDNLAAAEWKLSDEQVKQLDAASAVTPSYPYWHQMNFKERNPFPTM